MGALLKATRNGFEIPVYDDWDYDDGKIFVHRDSMGILGIVRAKSWEDAYSISEDEFMPEASETIEELRKEYGYRREHVKIVIDDSVLAATEHCGVGERFERYPEDYPKGRLAPTFLRWKTIETPDTDAWTENELFCESYGFRPNGPNASDKLGHGIYAKDLNGDSLDLLTPELQADLDIVLTFESDESEA
jgi:hypothetical protein